MTEWRVHVQCQQFDLEGLRDSLADHDPSIIQDGNDFYLISKEWAQTDEAREIHNRAKEFVELLENAVYIHSKDISPITIGAVVRIDDNGRKHHILIAPHGALRVTLQAVRLQATGTVSGAEKQAGEVRGEHPVVKLFPPPREIPTSKML